MLHQLSFKFFKFYKLKVRDSNLIPKQHGYKKVKNQITRRRSKQRMKNFSSNKVKFLCSFLILFTISERSSQTVIYTCFRFIVISFVYYTPFKKTLRLTRDLSYEDTVNFSMLLQLRSCLVKIRNVIATI